MLDCARDPMAQTGQIGHRSGKVRGHRQGDRLDPTDPRGGRLDGGRGENRAPPGIYSSLPLLAPCLKNLQNSAFHQYRFVQPSAAYHGAETSALGDIGDFGLNLR